MYNRETTKKVVIWGVILAIGAIIVAYALYASHGFIKGPNITILEPRESFFATSTIRVVGIADRAKTLKLNGKSIFIDEKGNFNEVILLSKGYNVESIEAQDKFGRIERVDLQIIYK
jgi:hypothetical protein